MKKQNKHRRRKTVEQRQFAKRFRDTFRGPRTVEEFFAMPERYRDIWRNVGQVVTEMREGTSRRRAAQKFGLNPRTVQHFARAALQKLENGRWVAKSHDRLLRVLVIPTSKGLREIGVSDSRQASLLGRYWVAVERYRDTGDASRLREFRGKYIIDANGKRVPLTTSLLELDRLGSAGVLSFESLYAGAA